MCRLQEIPDEIVPDSMPRRIQAAEGALFALIALAHVAPFLVFAHFPSQDGPAHVYNAVALHDFLTEPGGINEIYYQLNPALIANWATNGMMALLVHFVPPLVAEKVLLIGYVLFFSLVVWRSLGAIGPASRGFAILIFPFICGWTLHMGFYNFCYSLPLFVVVLCLCSRLDTEATAWSALRLAIVATLLCLVHPISFVAACISVLVLATWHALVCTRDSEHIATGRKSTGDPRWRLLRGVRTAAIGVAPGALILFGWVGASGRARNFHWLEWSHRWEVFAHLSTLAAYVEQEIFWTRATLLLLGTLLLIALLRRLSNFAPRPSDGLLLLSIALLGLYFASPDWAFGVGRLNYRLLLYPFFPLLLWLGAQMWPGWLRVGVQCAGAIIALALLAHRVGAYAELETYFREYTSVAAAIEPGRTILPLTLSETTPELRSQRLPDRIWPFLHAAGYLAAERRGVYLNNFEALLGTFPLRYRSDVNPNEYIGRVGDVPPRVDLDSYADRTPGSLDYVVLWSAEGRSDRRGRSVNEDARERWIEKLRRGFEVASVSDSGRIMLWRAKEMGGLRIDFAE